MSQNKLKHHLRRSAKSKVGVYGSSARDPIQNADWVAKAAAYGKHAYT